MPTFKIFSRTFGSFSSKLGIKHPWMQGNSIFTKIQKEMINFLIINVYSPSFVRIYSLIGIVCKISICKKGAIWVGIPGESTILWRRKGLLHHQIGYFPVGPTTCQRVDDEQNSVVPATKFYICRTLLLCICTT